MAILALLAACSGDDSASSNEVESSDDSYSLEASSSSVGSSSSSSEESSSSGMFVVDERDGQAYRTVVIGDQEWMAENLNYDAPNSHCLDDSCTDGRVYTWGSAMDASGLFSKNAEDCDNSFTCNPAYPVQGLCMKGWHLPNDSDWNVLLETAGEGTAATLPLKSRTLFWSSSEMTVGNFERANVFWPGGDEYVAGLGFQFRSSFFSIRCLKGAASNDTSLVGKLRSPSGKQYITFGTMTDERDGQTYKTVTINNQTWMAENLNYAYLQPTSTLDSSSWCYDNDPENCKKYGRLYLWSAAMDSAISFSDGGKGHGTYDMYSRENIPTRGVCPDGWHVPTDPEMIELFTIAEEKDSLKSSTGWGDGYNGSDHYGFGGIPAGSRVEGVADYLTLGSSFFWGIQKVTYFWTTGRNESYLAKDSDFSDYSIELEEYPIVAYSVRCIKDE